MAITELMGRSKRTQWNDADADASEPYTYRTAGRER